MDPAPVWIVLFVGVALLLVALVIAGFHDHQPLATVMSPDGEPAATQPRRLQIAPFVLATSGVCLSASLPAFAAINWEGDDLRIGYMVSCLISSTVWFCLWLVAALRSPVWHACLHGLRVLR